MARPGGNPGLEKYAFQTNRKEPLNKKITVRISESVESRLRQMEDYREFIRKAIEEKLKELDRAN